MGQRLVITLEQNEKEVAAIYYHWSAYTYSALQETKDVIDCIYNGEHEPIEGLLLRLIHHLEANGGGIDGADNEHEYIQKLYPNETFKTEGYSRNRGLIAISPQGIASMKRWSEGDVYINLDTDEVDFCIYSGYESLEEYLDARKEWDDEFDENDFKDIPKLNCCLGLFGIDEIDDVIAELDEVDGCAVIQCGDEICELIE